MTALLLTDYMGQLGEAKTKKTGEGMPLEIHLLNKRFLSYVTHNIDLSIYSNLDLKMALA